MKLKDILKELDLPKGKYVEPTSADVDDLKQDLYNLVANAYAPIGGHLKYKSPDKMTDPNLKFWRVADLDADPILEKKHHLELNTLEWDMTVNEGISRTF